jgi:hypothetical protein
MDTETVKTAKRSSKEIYAEMELKLKDALAEWKDNLGEKKFNRRIKKAARLVGKNIKPVRTKKLKPAKNKISASAAGTNIAG